jgi:tRNA pseudouridine55 synthase
VESSGFILLDKPAGITSFQALYPVKKVFRTRRVGHAGTLDQEASGLIVVAVGKCTRLLNYIEAQDKVYRFKLHLGRSTDTLEWTGNILEEDPNGARTGNALEVSLRHFIGGIDQVPPLYSAIKIEGRRASDLARKGQEVEMKSRRIQIHDLELAEYGCFVSPEPRSEFNLSCHCSKGTYIRSLARDIAADLGTLGCASQIRRTAIGKILVNNAVAPANLSTEHLLAPNLLLDWPTFQVDAAGLGRLLQGNWLAWPDAAEPGMAFVADAAGRIRMAVELADGRMAPCFHLE